MSVTRTARLPLSRARVLAAAIELADQAGIDAVSMRALAGTLDVVPMALYKHVRGKEELLSGMADAVITEYPDPPADAAWHDRVRSRSLAAREALVSHPWLRSVIETRRHRSEVVLDHMNAVAGDLLAGGLTVDLTHYAMHALGSRIWGFTAEAFSDVSSAKPSGPEHDGNLAALAARYPHILAIAADAAQRLPSGACDEQDEFEFTLDLLLDAVARLHASGWSSRPLTP